MRRAKRARQHWRQRPDVGRPVETRFQAKALLHSAAELHLCLVVADCNDLQEFREDLVIVERVEAHHCT
ncbi:unnamed protein product [Ceratitis capitata]|uniref:(Mediterranean fruit fly) hypothetical protein n=1 Tax=Ceratitis capitata TaxID=7213 RepID=A0A811UHT4_CERCA|nr:unnamed protein product [Ceratitis capitata]